MFAFLLMKLCYHYFYLKLIEGSIDSKGVVFSPGMFRSRTTGLDSSPHVNLQDIFWRIWCSGHTVQREDENTYQFCVMDQYLLRASNPMKPSVPTLNPFLYSLIPLRNCNESKENVDVELVTLPHNAPPVRSSIIWPDRSHHRPLHGQRMAPLTRSPSCKTIMSQL